MPAKSAMVNRTHFWESRDPYWRHPLETKLEVNKPEDEFEQEADRISEQVMRMPEPQIRRACGESGDWGQTKAPSLTHEVLNSPGQPLDPATRASMEMRFGHNLSRVRVHHDGKASDSAKSIQALAYTRGNHIVFKDGQYSPTTEWGKRLLAHELVHTMQQGNNILHRKIDFTQPTPTLADPIPLVLGGGSILGNTLPVFNGIPVPEQAIKKVYKEAVFKVLQPENFKFSVTEKGKTCKVDADQFNINVSAKVRAITEPQKDKWSDTYAHTVLSNPPSACAEKTNRIQVEMEGKPDSAALYKKVLAHEQEHVNDLEKLSNGEIKPYHDFLTGLTGTGKTDEECVNDIFKQAGKRDGEAGNNFVDKWLDAVQVYDKKGGPHHSKFETKVDAKCTKMQIIEKL